MKKNSSVLIIILVVIVLAGGAYAIFHKSSKPMPTTTASTTSKSSAPAVNNAVIITKTDGTVGQYLASPSGKALYVYGADTSGVSNCTGSCLTTWPAYVDTGSTTGLPTGITVITRADNGQMQYAYKGSPLYFFASDSTGQVTGNGVANFSVAKPAASSSSSSSSSSTSAPATTAPAPSSSSSSNNSSYNSPY